MGINRSAAEVFDILALYVLLLLLLLWPFVWDYLGEPEETFTHSPILIINLYQLLPSTMIHSIVCV